MPDSDPKRPLKYNVLWLIAKGYALDIEQFYSILREIRKMPLNIKRRKTEKTLPDESEEIDINKHKYTQIERALVQLQREGWPITKEIDNHGIAWYSAGPGFMEFFYGQLLKEVNIIVKKSKMRELKRFNEILGIEQRLSSHNEESETLIDLPMMLAKGEIPLKYVPYLLKPL